MVAIMEVPNVTIPMSQPPVNPRKRKKRTHTAGANADCFKCVERKISCDRRRPYCSQCLEVGQDCSGYKTQLTWGVGVASRGKLRGLSLPIAGPQGTVKAQNSSSEGSPPKPKKRRDTGGNASQATQSQLEDAIQRRNSSSQAANFQQSIPGKVKLELPLTTSSVFRQGIVWDPTFFSAPLDYNYAPPTPDSHATSRALHEGSDMRQENRSSQYSHPGVASWTQPQRSANIFTPQTTLATSTPGVTPSSAAVYFDRPESFSTAPEVVSPAQTAFPELSSRSTIHRSYDGISMLLEADQSMHLDDRDTYGMMNGKDDQHDSGDCAVIEELSLMPNTSLFDLSFPMPVLSGISHIGKTSRMQYLVNYYTEVISPVIVAFDSPSNPFRTQILRLAESSETLQHAIAALAASNLRQRRGIGLLSAGKTAPARRSSFAHVHLSNDYAQTALSPEEQMREEILHKRLAISQLNQQLGNPVLRKGDAVLATLLILCLFHICDSGIAKFQTQFAGVRKLLALRGDDMKIGSEDSRWMSRLFTWFDALAATVNDRERQISGQFIDMSTLCGDWALENLAGIDGQLFRSIAKLGRLNLLRQGKPTQSETSPQTPMMPPPMPTADTYATLDGNGWVRHDGRVGLGITRTDTDSSKEFWYEANAVRHELLSWQLDTTVFDSISREASNLTMEQRKDMEHISQSFRYSALLYIERLVQPTLPSSDETIQRWVRLSLNHIKEVISDVYLLWPLFITGTECIDDKGRNVIRGRCASIQQDSGFVNNASCLQLLEKIWRATSPHSSPGSDEASTMSSSWISDQPTSNFVFRDVMMKEAARTEGDGEYLVV